MYAELVVNVPHLTQTFHYSLPAELAGQVRVGHLVTVPFGGRKAQGVVMGLSDSAPVAAVKTIEGLVDPAPVLTPAQLNLAYWISHTYLAPLIECLTLMLPPGLSKMADVLYSLPQSNDSPSPVGGATTGAPQSNQAPDGGGGQGMGAQQSILRLLGKRGPLRGRQLDRALPKTNWRSAAEALARRGLITRHSILEAPSVRAKHVRTARLAATLQQVEAAKPNLSKHPAKAARLTAILDFLADEFDPVDVSWVYAETRCDLQDLKDLAEAGLVELGETEIWRDSLGSQEFVPVDPPELTPDQQSVWESVVYTLTHAPPYKPILLHGVTGSGKTEIYLRALGEAIRQGKQAIVLVPEIALTPQTVRRFAVRFPGQVAVWHSQLGEGERYDTWRRARSGLVNVVVGARSALFAPLPNLGLIVLDEEHDEAYKQDPPFSVPYHAREAAVEYARQAGAVCLLGSATPDIVSYYRAKQNQYQLLELPRRIMGHKRKLEELAQKYHLESHYQPLTTEGQTIDLPPVTVVDMRQELRAGNTSIFSRKLHTALTEVLARHEQAILFLNRRGTATFVFCRDCGEALKCARCDMPLTYHTGKGVQLNAPTEAAPVAEMMVCHHCNNRRGVPKQCPQCGSQRIRYFGAGTEKLEEAVRAAFPAARTLRWDHDVTRFKGAHDLILQQFSTQQADVLIGTQMIAKGLDLPLVTLVGVISADVGLGLPDYRASERNFQILTQVAGRAGRSLLGGQVVMQTYQPEHYAIQAAAKHDYAEFFARELRYRKDLGYPPFRRVMRMVYRHARNDSAEAEALVVARQLQLRLQAEKPIGTDLSGPAPCFFGKIANEYRWQIVVRSPDPAALARDKVFKGWYVDVDPVSTL